MQHKTGPVVIKTAQFDRGYESLLKREGTFAYTEGGTRVPSLNTGVWCVLDEQGVGGKMFITRANAAS
jgi:hypothetical protein